MEGPLLRNFPRMVFDFPVELGFPDRALRLPHSHGNLSRGGLFLVGPDAPEGTPVRVKISAREPFEADGVIRYREGNGNSGIGIEFTALTDEERARLDDLIAELTRKGAPVC